MAYYIMEDECNGCTSCATICPTGAATGEKKELHTVDSEVCVECGACGKLCPQGAVRDQLGRVPLRMKRKELEKPLFDNQKCNGCVICLDVCPTDCISLGEANANDPNAYPEVTVASKKKCIGCGFCAQACPVDAIEMHTDDTVVEKLEKMKTKKEKNMIWNLKKIYIRVFQFIMRAFTVVLPFPVPVLLTGAGSVKKLAENLRVQDIKNVLVVTDKTLMDLKRLDDLLASLSEKNIKYTVFDDVQPNPTIENVEVGKAIYKQNKCKAIIAFGGGSPIDCAKVIGARIRNPYLPVRFMKGLFRVIIPIPPLFCIPTTAGTGSETTVVAVITNKSTHEKFAISDLKLVPKIAVLDPELMVGLPPYITSATGMDALTHAVEAYIGQSGNAYTDESAKYATRLIIENIEKAFKDNSDLEARDNMAIASFYAGAAFTRAYVGYVHAIAHNMGGLYDVPHGLANAIILPYVLEFCKKEAENKLADLAVACGFGGNGDSSATLADRFIDKVRSLNKKMNIPTYIKELKESDIHLIAERALKESHPLYPVPKLMTHEQCEELVTKLLPCV